MPQTIRLLSVYLCTGNQDWVFQLDQPRMRFAMVILKMPICKTKQEYSATEINELLEAGMRGRKECLVDLARENIDYMMCHKEYLLMRLLDTLDHFCQGECNGVRDALIDLVRKTDLPAREGCKKIVPYTRHLADTRQKRQYGVQSFIETAIFYSCNKVFMKAITASLVREYPGMSEKQKDLSFTFFLTTARFACCILNST